MGALSGRAWIVLALLVMDALIVGGAFLARLWEMDLLQRLAQAPRSVTLAEAEASDTRVNALATAHLVVFIVTAIAFLVWTYSASKRAHKLGALDMRFTPRASVLWFFVPFANLVQPYRAIAEIWKLSDPTIDRTNPAGWQNASVSPLLPLWWIGYIGTNVVSRFVPTSIPDNVTIQRLMTISELAAAVAAGIAISAVLACIVIVRIESRLRASEAAGPLTAPGVAVASPLTG